MPKHLVTALETIDLHAAGEPCRIVFNALCWLPGNTMRERLDYMIENVDSARSFLMKEPRGHKDMFGAIFTPPISPEADTGIIYMNSDGYLDMCIHGTICSTRAMIELERPLKNLNQVVFDTVNGLVKADVVFDEHEKIKNITIQNVPSFILKENVELDLPNYGKIVVDVVFAGNFFVLVDSLYLGNLDLDSKQGSKLIDFCLAVRDEANRKVTVSHPQSPASRKIQLVALYQIESRSPLTVKNAVVFADGQMDRSPCGSGTSALMTYFNHKGELDFEQPYISHSIINSTFQGSLSQGPKIGHFNTVIPHVTGVAYMLGRNHFVREKTDPFFEGFLLS